MDSNANAPTVGPVRRSVRITNPQGLHMRPARAFVELAGQFRSQIRVQRDQQPPVEGNSVMSLLLLGAEQGIELTVEADGPDALAALDALVELLANLETRVDAEAPE
jgi:phosphocarrier protein HPr